MVLNAIYSFRYMFVVSHFFFKRTIGKVQIFSYCMQQLSINSVPLFFSEDTGGIEHVIGPYLSYILLY